MKTRENTVEIWSAPRKEGDGCASREHEVC